MNATADDGAIEASTLAMETSQLTVALESALGNSAATAHGTAAEFFDYALFLALGLGIAVLVWMRKYVRYRD